MTRILCVLLTLLFLPFSSFAEEAPSPRPVASPEDAECWVTELFGDVGDEFFDKWQATEEMRLMAALSGGMPALKRSLSVLGEPLSIGPAFSYTSDGYLVFRVPCVFAEERIDMILATLDGAVAGLNTGDFTSPQTE